MISEALEKTRDFTDHWSHIRTPYDVDVSAAKRVLLPKVKASLCQHAALMEAVIDTDTACCRLKVLEANENRSQ